MKKMISIILILMALLFAGSACVSVNNPNQLGQVPDQKQQIQQAHQLYWSGKTINRFYTKLFKSQRY